MVKNDFKDFSRIIYKKDGHIGWIILNRPEVKNAQDPITREELVQALTLGRDDSDVYLIVITGKGENFCAGGDITDFPKNSVEFMERIGLQVLGKKRPVDMIREIPKPVIAMVKGLALGAGMELALACDIIVASEDAKFGQPEIKVGLIPGGGGTQILPRLIGEKKAKEMIFTGKVITAKSAFDMGLVNMVTPPDRLKEGVDQLTSDLLRKSPLLLKFAKMAVNKVFELPLSQGLAYESNLCAICFDTDDLKEGVKAFKEKRPPSFKGK